MTNVVTIKLKRNRLQKIAIITWISVVSLTYYFTFKMTLVCVRNAYCLFDDKGCSLLLPKCRNKMDSSPKLRFVIIIYIGHSSARIRDCFSIIKFYTCTTKHHLYNVLKNTDTELTQSSTLRKWLSKFFSLSLSLCSWRWVSVTRKWSWE